MYICLVGRDDHLSSGDCFYVTNTLHEFLEMIDIHVLKNEKELNLLLDIINHEEYTYHVRKIEEN